MWHAFFELVQALILAVAHACGGSVGGAIAIVSFAVRLALIPLTRRLAERARVRQAVLAGLKPQIARVKKRHAKDPRRLAEETLALYKRNGVKMFDGAVRAGLGAGKRFLWIADLARPDAAMALVASALVGISIALGSAESAEATRMLKFSALLAAGTTLWFLFSASGALAVSVAAGAVATTLDGLPKRASRHV